MRGRKPKNGEEADIMAIRWEDGERSTVRTPTGLRQKISDFLKELALETGVQFARNEFILNSIRFYLRYLLQSTSTEDLLSRMKEKFKGFDNGDEPPIESVLEGEDEHAEFSDDCGGTSKSGQD